MMLITPPLIKQHNKLLEVYEDGTQLFCPTCNIVLVHKCKSILADNYLNL